MISESASEKILDRKNKQDGLRDIHVIDPIVVTEQEANQKGTSVQLEELQALNS